VAAHDWRGAGAKALKMYGMAQAVGDLIEQGAPAFDAAVPILAQLLKAEMAEREVRSIAYPFFPAFRLGAAGAFSFRLVERRISFQLLRIWNSAFELSKSERAKPPKPGPLWVLGAPAKGLLFAQYSPMKHACVDR
jgi:hypothetical protein